MVIGLTGPKLAGKGTAAAYLVDNYDAVAYSMSGILSDIARRLHLENSRANLIAIVNGLRDQFGEDILAHVLKEDILQAKDSIAIIDGIRMQKEVDVFSQLPDFKLIYIDAAVEDRYHRALNRGEKAGETDMTFEEFKAEEGARSELQITSLRDKADIVLDNTATIEDFHSALRSELRLSER